MTLSQFLLERIAEDETNIDGDWASGDGGLHIISTPMHDRMLAEVEAKRRIVGIYHDVWMSKPDDGEPSVPLGGDGPETYYETMQHLAAVYSDHPDYDEAWRA